jgi:stage III sporulation protein AD
MSIAKVVGVAYITEFSAQLCSDAGENALAQKVELGGKLVIIAIASPIILHLVNVITHA